MSTTDHPSAAGPKGSPGISCDLPRFAVSEETYDAMVADLAQPAEPSPALLAMFTEHPELRSIFGSEPHPVWNPEKASRSYIPRDCE